jgi:hypothetical protein
MLLLINVIIFRNTTHHLHISLGRFLSGSSLLLSGILESVLPLPLIYVALLQSILGFISLVQLSPKQGWRIFLLLLVLISPVLVKGLELVGVHLAGSLSHLVIVVYV